MANTNHLGLLTAVGLLVTWLVVVGCGEQENAPQIKVAFVRESDSNVDIYRMNADSSSQTRLTDNREIDVDPSGSPDGKKIAFASNRDGNFDIYTMSAEGSGVTNLTQDPYDDRQPTWSPDGKKIAFASNRSGNFDIYVMNADGSGVTNLTQVPLSAELLARLTQKYPQSDEVLAWLLNDQLPAWSPDGKKIAFASNSRGNFDIYVMNADGTTRTRITTNDADDGNPYWSPDGKRIAFASNRDGEMFDIFVMGADGSTVDNLTNNPANDLDPVWLPDGKKIAFASNRHNDWDLYRMTPDGTKQTHLTSDRSKETLPAFFAVESSGSEPEQASEKRAAKQSIAKSSHPIKLTNDSKFHSPIWSPDGKKIAMLGDDGIYVMNADGSKVTNLSNYVATGGSLAWSPDGEKIAFASDRSGNSDVYIMNADGSGVTDLTGNPEQDAGFGWSSGGEHGTHVTDERGNDRFPEWSPSGEKIAFTSDRDGNVEIYVMNADGSGVTNLTHNPAADGSSSFEESDAFAWSPDGEKIVFQSDRDAAIVGEIYVMNADGSGVTNLTHYQGYDASPRWSPDGQRISFHSGWGGGGGFPDVYVMNADGTNRTRLTNNTRASTDWSPNGKQIVVSSLHGDRRVDSIYVMNADGSGVTNLTHYSEQEASDQDVLQIADPHWSPDGKRILFTRTSGTPALGIQENIYVMDVEVEN